MTFDCAATCRQRVCSRVAVLTLLRVIPFLAVLAGTANAAGPDLVVQNLAVSPTSGAAGYVWVILDVTSSAGQGTANEGNDKSATVFTVTAAGAPDLVVQNLAVSPTSGAAGSAATVSFTIRNPGTATAGASTTNLRLATSGSTVTTSDPLLATLNTPSLAAGATTTVTQGVTIPAGRTAGTNYVWVILDVTSSAGQGTANESNDKSATVFTVTTGPEDSCVLTCGPLVTPTAQVNIPVEFLPRTTSNGCTGTVAHSWDFGDQSTSSQERPSHTYAQSGSFDWRYSATSGTKTCTGVGRISVAEGHGTVVGYVTASDTSRPVAGAQVSIGGLTTQPSATTGFFQLSDVPAGQQLLTATAAGYSQVQQHVSVTRGSTTHRDVALTPSSGIVRVLSVTSRYRPGTHYADGVRFPLRFTASIDWAGRQPGEVLWHTPRGTYSTQGGQSLSREFDMGADFGPCGTLQVQAVAADGTRSALFTADFVITVGPPLLTTYSARLVDYGDGYKLEMSVGRETSLGSGSLSIRTPDDLEFLNGLRWEAMPTFRTSFDSDGRYELELAAPVDTFAAEPKTFGRIHFGSLEIALDSDVEVLARFNRTTCDWEVGGFVGVKASGDFPTVRSPFLVPLPPPLPPVPAYWKVTGDWSVAGGFRVHGVDELQLEGSVRTSAALSGRVAAGVDNFVSVGGQLTGDLESEVVLPTFSESDLTVGVEAELGVYSFLYELTFTLLRCEIGTDRDPSCRFPRLPWAGDGLVAQGLAVAPTWRALSRHYLFQPGYAQGSVRAPLGAQVAVGALGTSPVQANVFPFSAAALSNAGGRPIAAWLHDDPSRAANDRTVLVASSHDGETWAPRTAIDDDGTADFHPQVLGWPDGAALAVWENASQRHGEGASYADILAGLDISAAVFDARAQRWSSPTRLGNQPWMDYGPRIAGRSSDNVLAMWLSNAANSAGGAATLTEIWASRWTGVGWSAPARAATMGYGVLQHALAHDGHRSLLVLSCDTDGDFSTVDDRELFAVDATDGVWSEVRRLTNDGVADESPQVAATATGFLLVWVRGRALLGAHDTDVSRATTLLHRDAGTFTALRMAANDAGQASIVWVEPKGRVTDLTTISWDAGRGSVGVPRGLTADEDVETAPAVVVDASGTRAVLFNATRRTDGEGGVAAVLPGVVGTVTDLRFVASSPGLDAAVSGRVTWEPVAPRPGDPAHATITIENVGDLPLSNLTVTLRIAGTRDTEVGRTTIAGPLLPGRSVLVAFIVVVPTDSQGLTWHAAVAVEGDVNPSNNDARGVLAQPDLSLSAAAWRQLPTGAWGLPVRVQNRGSAVTPPTTLTARRGAGSASVWASVPFGQLSAGAYVDVEVPWDPVALGDVPTLVTVSVDEAGLIDESEEQNNFVVVTSFAETPSDRDADGLPDAWETAFGLRTDSGLSSDGPLGDADGDGVANLDEWRAQTHPLATRQQFLAEGATGGLFGTALALLNTSTGEATANLRFLKRDGTISSQALVLAPRSRATVDVASVAGMDVAEFSTTVESDRALVVDRTMRWDPSGYGAHTETAIAAPARTWYLAEGATHSGFDLFYLLQNPSDVATTVRVRYLRPSGAPLEKTYALPPTSRTNIWVDHEEFAGLGTALATTDVSAVIEVLEGAPIIVERAMYLSSQGRLFNAGHESVGITAPATTWFLAEGATGGYFDLFILIANPATTTAQVEVTYLLPDGSTLVKPYQVGPTSRFNIWVDYEDARLADTAVSTTVRSTNGVPLIVERAMWWPGGPTTWHEAHNSAGATTTGTRWALAEGEVDAARNLETYILVANTSPTPADVKVTLVFEDGTQSEQTFTGIAGRSRFNVPVGYFFPAAAGKRFGAILESVGPTPAQIVVERAVYWDAAGQRWAAGTNALATKLR